MPSDASTATTGTTRAQLQLGGHGRSARTRRFSADVNDLRALVGQAAAVRDGVLGVGHTPPSENESGVTLSAPTRAPRA